MDLANMLTNTAMHDGTMPARVVLAYLDPGSGSFLLQLLIGTVLGGLVVFKGYLKKLKSLFLGRDRVIQTEEEKSNGERYTDNERR